MRTPTEFVFSVITGSCAGFLQAGSISIALALAIGAPAALGAADAQAADLEEILVTASLRPEPASRIPVSTTILDSATLHSAGLQHFGDVLGLVPNLNWSGGSSRPRYFQLRGIGELEQYQGAPNPSVGFLIDEVDFSGVGMPATLFDVEQVEVLRGPQGTRYGANALAGLIKIDTHDPEAVHSLQAQAMAGEDGLWGGGVQAGGPLAKGRADAAWRLVAQRLESDGFRRNDFLAREDTNGRRETTVRGKLRLDVSDAWRIDLGGMHVDLDNGYDAFAPENWFTTHSDRPGRDAQRSLGGSVIATGDLGPLRLISTSAYADSDIDYSFDGDWGNDPYWGEFAPYDYYTSYQRRRRTFSEDLRLVSASTAVDDGFGWVAGIYALSLGEDGLQRDEFAGEPLRVPLASDYGATNLAGYGEVEWRLASAMTLSAGLRAEGRSANYSDSDGADFDPDDRMVGGHVSLRGQLAPAAGWYVTASRGYKAGGFNIGQLVPEDRRTFAPEYLWNLEGGIRFAPADAALEGELSLFYMWRDDQQVATSFQVVPGDPLSYIFFTDNAASGRNYGLEARLAWRPLDALTVQGTLGLLHSEYIDYHYGDRDLDGREQAHAPAWQYSVTAEWRGQRGLMLRADLAGTDAFYFDASHDQRSEPRAVGNLKAGYSGPSWAVYGWGRNVFDESYAVRGFYFGLEPPDFANKLYVQRGDPRQFGVTVEWRTP
jgi:iron complex outermembrane recepter protein